MARILKDYPDISLKTEDLGERVDFVRIFGRSGPVHIEIGSGKGTFLLNEALSKPDLNFLGIEWANKYYRYAVDRIGRWSLSNVRIIRTEASGFLTDLVPCDSVDCFHIYFPDPWPKKRHHKRRFICEANLDNMIRCLKKNGQIRIATDHTEYFERIKSVIDATKEKLEKIDFPISAGAETGEWIGTNFERKYIKEKRCIHTLAVIKK